MIIERLRTNVTILFAGMNKRYSNINKQEDIKKSDYKCLSRHLGVHVNSTIWIRVVIIHLLSYSV